MHLQQLRKPLFPPAYRHARSCANVFSCLACSDVCSSGDVVHDWKAWCKAQHSSSGTTLAKVSTSKGKHTRAQSAASQANDNLARNILSFYMGLEIKSKCDEKLHLGRKSTIKII